MKKQRHSPEQIIRKLRIEAGRAGLIGDADRRRQSGAELRHLLGLPAHPLHRQLTSGAAAPDPTLTAVLVVFAVAAIAILPALGLLNWLTQRELLDE